MEKLNQPKNGEAYIIVNGKDSIDLCSSTSNIQSVETTVQRSSGTRTTSMDKVGIDKGMALENEKYLAFENRNSFRPGGISPLRHIQQNSSI